ncbi:MAG: histidine kinase [Deltaproteobacteria bacterium]|nr:histidine kinase [Deltaproteobacteria bacterium]
MVNFNKFFAFSKNYSLGSYFKNYLKLIFVWCPIVTILFAFGFSGFENFAQSFSTSMIIVSTTASSCFLGSRLIRYLFNYYRIRRGQKPKECGFFWGVLTSYPFLPPGLYLGFMLAGKFSAAIGYTWTAPIYNDYASGIIFGIMVSVLFTLFEVIRESKEAKQSAELKCRTLENEKLKAQISALTAQMNPHLLFNTLNTIVSTITTDPKSAEDMVVQLSELYRGILHAAKEDIHTLENELLLCKSYLEIERKRFGPRIAYQFNIEDKIDPKKIKIPVLLLQPLVENAVKHGLTPKRSGGNILIEVKRNGSSFVISIIDNGVGIDVKKPSDGTGTGLLNCKSRIKLKYGENSKFSFNRNERNETTVSISIPLKEAACD